MEKVLLKKISINLSIITIILITVFTLILFRESKNINFDKCEQLLKQVNIYYEQSKENLGEEILTYKEEYIIGNILKNITILYEQSVFAIDKISGEILGSTENNEKELNFSGVNNNKDILNILNNSTNGKFIRMNGSYKFLKTKIIDNIILVSCIDGQYTINQIINQIIYIIIILSSVFVLLLFIIKNYFSKYILIDFQSIEKNIRKIVSGDLNVDFQTKNKENKYLMKALNDWRDNYKYKNSRMTKMISSIDSNIALFECLYYINKNFFSNNLQLILGLNDIEWSRISINPKEFEAYIKELIKLADSNGIVYLNDKYLFIKSYNMGNEFFGIIVDKSSEIKKLKEAKSNAEKDNLTNLLNRSAFEKQVNKALLNNSDKGIMLIFDLDNFKQINDRLGHPEGDKVLKITAECIKLLFRREDVIARLGGDEFVVFINHNISPKTLDNKLKTLLNNIRKNLSYYYNNYNVSVSIGVAYVDNRIDGYEGLYKCADTALYIAKDLGKDRYYINEENITCMRGKCIQCTGNCKKRKRLGL